jgi:hypothetical protein
MIIAFVKNEIVENIVEAEADTPLSVLFPEVDEFVEFTSTTGIPHMGLKCKGGKFQPYASWTWDAAKSAWAAPSPQPSASSYWDEASLSWIEVTDGID